MQFLDTLLQMLADKGSDLYLSVGSPPMMKIQGRMAAIGDAKLKAAMLLEIARELLGQDGVMNFAQDKSANFAHSVPGVGRFRVNGFFQRNEVGFVIRAIRSNIPTLDDLRLPPIIGQLALEKRGLILFVGATGSGKSTSLAAMVQHRNQNEAGHILTIEDPIEFLHTNAKSLVNQREVGIDAVSYQDALENALRQAPDVILMGEVRARETMDYAVAFAETGHLCLSTLHANNANQAIDRIINFFPADRRNQLLMDLSLNLRAIVSQRLLPTTDGGRAAAIEVMINTPRISELILKGEIHSIKDTMEKGAEYGMRTFDQALLEMVLDGRIDEGTALKNADSQNNLRLMIREQRPASAASATAQEWSVQ
ncbi:MAG: PilT/PilU family type 4a pilus ATPase [Acidithiobacillus sp.]|nr:PilT/PilU family type 4a pilus ATPase [Acidithiobacillus sp.]